VLEYFGLKSVLSFAVLHGSLPQHLIPAFLAGQQLSTAIIFGLIDALKQGITSK
jgi:hypothetical protein